MAGCATEKVRVAVMYFAPNSALAPFCVRPRRKVALAHLAFVGVAVFARRNASTGRLGWIEKGARQSQRCENLLLSERVEIQSGQPLQQEPEQDESQITVGHLGARGAL